jgi:hypothetical protein
MDKNCYCKGKNIILTESEFMTCDDCGKSSECLTYNMIKLDFDTDNKLGENLLCAYSDLPKMKQMVSQYRREKKLKRIING